MNTQDYDKPIYECPAGSAIPIVTVENTANIKTLRGCYVYVTEINTLFYIDNRHNIVTVSAGPVTVDNYDLDENPLRLRNQLLFTTDNNDNELLVFYTARATYKIITTEE